MNENQPVVPATPAPVATPAVVQAPATPTVPVETPATPAVVPPVAATPAVVAPPEQLLVPQIQKPTVEALKLPKDHLVPPEALAEYVSQSKTPEEAQSKAEMAVGMYASGMKRLENQNQTWLGELKADPELGGPKWDETKALFNSGIRRLFGDGFATKIAAAKLETMPDLVRGIVRAERAAGVRPIVNPPSTPPPPAPLKPHEVAYGPDKTYNEKDPKTPLATPRW